MITAKSRVNEGQFKRMQDGFNRRLGKNLDDVNLKISNITKEYIVRQYLAQTKKASRISSANRVKVRKIKPNHSEIVSPKSMYYLDTMESHWVSLKRGRLITKWASKHLDGSYPKTGQSRFSRGPRGGIKGKIYVTKDPFVTKALNRVRGRYKGLLKGSIKKALKR